jgi:hypothetical protein
MQKVAMDFFLHKDIATLTMSYANIQSYLQSKRIDWYMITMQKKTWEVLNASKF